MTAKERREKEKIERKKLILNSALNLIRTSGIEGLTIRKLAEMITYSSCVVYESFPDKNSIIAELFSTVCQELLTVIRSIPPMKTPETYFKKLIAVDIDFMMKEPYRVELFTLVTSTTSPKNFPPQMQEVVQLIGESLRALNYKKLSTQQEIEDAQDILRTFLAGLLKLSPQGPTKCKFILKNALQLFLDGWKN